MNDETPIKQALSSLAILAIVHGLYFMITGLWPLVHMESFVAVTGPKEDYWLVRTVAMLTSFIGTGLLIAGIKKHVSFPMIVTVAGSAFGFLLIDVIYVLQNVLWPVYLLDAGVELVFFVAWVVLTYRSGNYELFYERPV